MMVQPKSSVKDVEKYSPPTADRKGATRLDFNENTRGCSPAVARALKNLTVRDISTYPDYKGLPDKIAEYVGFGTSGKNILITDGSDEAIRCIMATYIECGDEVIIPVPTFTLYSLYARISGARIVEIPYKSDMSFPKDAVLSAINPDTKVVIIVNPNNPTGSVVPEEDILRIIIKAEENDAIVLTDEAYFEYYGKTSADISLKYRNVVVLRTFSKAFGLAGLRIGYAVSAEENISNLLKVRSPYSIGTPACIAAQVALSDIRFVSDYVCEVKKSRDFLSRELSRLGIKCFPSSANFILADFKKDSFYVKQRLALEKILTRVWPLDRRLRGYIRITAGTEEETKKAIFLIQSALSVKDALVFDMDGVLVDVSRTYRKAARETCGFFTGRDVKDSEIQAAKNAGGANNDWELCLKIINNNDLSVPMENIIAKFQEFYMKCRLDEKWLLSEDILSGLSKKYRLAIFTGRPKDEVLFTLDRFGMAKYFPVIVAMEDVPPEKAKPSPFGLLKAMGLLGCGRGYYAGDTVDDMRSAKAAGIRSIGILPPQDKSLYLKGQLCDSGAETVISDVNNISGIVEVL